MRPEVRAACEAAGRRLAATRPPITDETAREIAAIVVAARRRQQDTQANSLNDDAGHDRPRHRAPAP